MTAMPFQEFEQAYEALAEAIDRAGPRNESLFLAKLALTLANQSGSVGPFRDAIEIALRDLPDVPLTPAADDR
jgi:hypothetical protein